MITSGVKAAAAQRCWRGLQLCGAALRVGGEIHIDAAEEFAPGATVSDGSAQEGLHGHVEQEAQFLVGEAVSGFAEQALDGGGQGAVAREPGIAESEQGPKRSKRSGSAGGVEAAVVVVAAQVADLGEVAEGGAAGGLAEGALELFERNGRTGGQQREEQVG